MNAQVVLLTRQCSKCEREKPVEEFYFPYDRGRYTPACKDCQRAATAGWRANNPARARELLYAWREQNMDKMTAATERWRERNPEKQQANARRYGLRRFGLTPEQYDAMLASQQFSCAICRKHQTL